MAKTKISNIFLESQSNKIENKTLNQIKLTLRELLLTSTVHSIPNIVKTHYSLVKILWLFFFSLSTILAINFTKNSVLEYLEYEKVTKYQVINEIQSDFPTITFCSENSFNFTSLDDLIVNCLFNADTSCFLQKSAYFESYYDIGYGLCYRFNGAYSHLFKSFYSGIRFGLSLELNIRNYSDLIISINNKTHLPYSLVNKETYIAPFTSSFFVVSRIFLKRLPKPYNDCYEDLTTFEFNKTFINMILKENRTYSQKECLELCGFSYYLEHSTCGCHPPIRNVEVSCFLKASNEKVKNCTIDFVGRNLKNIMTKTCLNYCPLECESNGLSIEKYSTNSIGSTKIRVYLDDLQYTIISQDPKTYLFELIANIGGVLGLFLGISFLSFIEILEIILEIIFILMKAK